MIARKIWKQFKSLRLALFIAYIPTLFALSALVILAWRNNIPILNFTRDPLAVLEAPSYIGIVSNIGILLWCSSAAICLFSFAVIRQDKNIECRRFLLFSGVITSILLLDDLFLLHERILPEYLYIPEKIIMIGYGIMILFYLARFVKIILKTEFILLFFAFGFFGLSMVIDKTVDMGTIHIPIYQLSEDGSKFLGIVTWFTYFARMCLKQLRIKTIEE